MVLKDFITFFLEISFVILCTVCGLLLLLVALFVIVSIHACKQNQKRLNKTKHYEKLTLKRDISISREVIPIPYPKENQNTYYLPQGENIFHYDGEPADHSDFGFKYSENESHKNYDCSTPPGSITSRASSLKRPLKVVKSSFYHSDSDTQEGFSLSEVADSEPFKGKSERACTLDLMESSSFSSGKLKFTLKYETNNSRLIIEIKKAFDLKNIYNIEESDFSTYVTFCLIPEDFGWFRTRIIESNQNPEYNETVKVHNIKYHKLREYSITFFVMHCGIAGERPIGRLLFSLNDIQRDHVVELCEEVLNT